MKFSIENFFSKQDQIHSFLWIWSHLLKKSFMEIFIFFTVNLDTDCYLNICKFAEVVVWNEISFGTIHLVRSQNFPRN